VPPPDIMSPQVPARPPLEDGAYAMSEQNQVAMEDVMPDSAVQGQAIHVAGSSLGVNILDTPPIPALSAMSPSADITALDGAVAQLVKADEGSATPEQPPTEPPFDTVNGGLRAASEGMNVDAVALAVSGGIMDGLELDLPIDSEMFDLIDSVDFGLPLPPPPPPPTKSASSVEHVDVDLGPLKSVSRNHAKIDFRAELGHFCLEIQGRNGAWVDDRYYVKGSAVPLYQGSVLCCAREAFS
jgi:hypothetical protein